MKQVKKITVLRGFWSKAAGCIIYPLPLVMIWKKAKFRSICNPTSKKLKVCWYVQDRLVHTETVEPWTFWSPVSAKCDRIYEYEIKHGIDYPFD